MGCGDLLGLFCVSGRVGRALKGRPSLGACVAVAASALIGCGDADFSENIAETSSEIGLTNYGKKALLITDTSVIRDSVRTSDPCDAQPGAEDRAWTIGHILKEVAARQQKNVNDYVTSWINAWAVGATVNGQSIPMDNASGPLVKANWPKNGQGQYLLHKAPFKLIAIVSRLDLRTVRPSGEPLGGEIRFVFAPQYNTGAVSTPPADGRCMTHADEASTIILEFSPAKANENDVVSWAKKWHALGSMAFGPSYRTELAKLTEEVLKTGRLLRIRTNEAPGGVRWTFTEFEHDPGTKFLKRSTVKQSPAETLHTQNSAFLGQWIVNNKAAIQGTKTVGRDFLGYPVSNYYMPTTSSGTILRGAFNRLDSTVASSFFWNAANPGIFQGEFDELRHLFSLATCSGCHGRETDTGFLHIQSSDAGAATISNFLSGPLTVADPVTGENRQFDEMGRREEDLKALVSDGWVAVPVVANTAAHGGPAAQNYKLVFWHSGKCLDVAGQSTADNALVKQYACHGGGNQRVSLVDKGQSTYNLVFKHSGKCLDIEGGSSATGARMVQKTCSNAASQRLGMWFASPGRGARILQFVQSTKCVRVQNNSTAEAAQVVQDTCTQDDDKSLKFVE
jgi:Ricin-type beta-trefoil lectin domain-like